MKKDNKLSEDAHFIINVLKYLGAKNDDIFGFMFFLTDEDSGKAAKKIKKYIEVKGSYITCQDIFSKITQIKIPTEQYYPCEMYVRYTGETTEQLSHNKIYLVNMVFGADEYYLIELDDNCFERFSAELFEIQKVTEIMYIGSTNEDGTALISDGFTVGQKYKVASFKMGRYTCKGGLECMLAEVTPTGFQAQEPESPMPFDNMDKALKKVRRALEFGNIRDLSIHLHPECEYIFQAYDKELHSKDEIIKHLQELTSSQLEDDVFIDCALATITKSEEGNKFSVGERCIAIYEEDRCENVVFVTLSKDKEYITGIYVLNEPYEFFFDEE